MHLDLSVLVALFLAILVANDGLEEGTLGQLAAAGVLGLLGVVALGWIVVVVLF